MWDDMGYGCQGFYYCFGLHWGLPFERDQNKITKLNSLRSWDLYIFFISFSIGRVAKMEKISNIVNANVICGVCKDRYVSPKVLPCQHTFCMECISGCVAQLSWHEQVLSKFSIFAIFNSISFIFF